MKQILLLKEMKMVSLGFIKVRNMVMIVGMVYHQNPYSEIEVFSVNERNQRKRMNVARTYIYNKTRKYVIVLEPQIRNGEAYYLLTAYYLNKEYGEKQMQKKLLSKLTEVL